MKRTEVNATIQKKQGLQMHSALSHLMEGAKLQQLKRQVSTPGNILYDAGSCIPALLFGPIESGRGGGILSIRLIDHVVTSQAHVPTNSLQ